MIALIFPSKVLASEKIWQIQSIDTMKYSRDMSRNPAVKKFIPQHVAAIAQTGANYVALDTPYDDEFIPILKLWVAQARKYKMNVWFRGNFSGWEGWFEYPKISSTAEHISKTYRFITQNPDLFLDGDIFTPAPEAENGILGDPRRTGKKEEFNKFLSDSYDNCMKAFSVIKRAVNCGVWSLNTDVIRETVYPQTIAKMGGIVSIDHYARTPEKLIEDVKALNKQFNAKVVLGEFGAPIPDINGAMTEDQQADYIDKVGQYLLENREIVAGANYWVIAGGSTSLLNNNGTKRKGLASLKKYYDPAVVKISVEDEYSQNGIGNVSISIDGRKTPFKTDQDGVATLPLIEGEHTVSLTGESYKGKTDKVAVATGEKKSVNAVLTPVKKSLLDDIIKFIRGVFKK